MSYITLLPAYGRDYESAKAVKEDWKADEDFLISCIGHRYDGKLINRSQAIETNDKYSIRYSKLTKVVNVT